MVAGAFPVVKLAYLALKQISKPIANQIKRSARSSPFFRKYICMPPAQLYHWTEVTVRLRTMGLGKTRHVSKLNDDMAIDLGAEMLGEFVVFAVAAMTIWLEYHRSAQKETLKQQIADEALIDLHQKIMNFCSVTRSHEAQIQGLQRTLTELESKNHCLITTLFGEEEPPK